jgi:hypothetical protein
MNFDRIRSATPVIIATVCFLVVGLSYACTAKAQERPSLTPQQKATVVWAAANALTSFAVGWFVLPAVTIAGKQEALCSAMHGKYDPKAQDLCEGGDWVRIIPYLRDIKEN